jgi:hypothetical protein
MTARSTDRPKAIDSFLQIATLRIELEDSDPPIWRLVEVPTSVTLKVLHDMVQAAMGWFDYHLWEMRIDGQTYGLPMEDDWGTASRKIAARIRLRDVLAPGATTIAYSYDFGDDWQHTLTLTDVRQGDPALAYPRFIGGERECPPEDCGGISGFYDMLEIRSDPTHEQYVEINDWLDGYDPDELDTLPIEAGLARIAARRNAAAKRIVKPNAT